MEPVVFHPEGNDNKDTDNESVKSTITEDSHPNSDSSSDSPALSGTIAPEGHTEIIPSLEIPTGSPAAKPKKSKKGLVAGLAVVIVFAAAAFGAFQVLSKKDDLKLVADPAAQQISELRVGTTYPPFNKIYPDPSFVVAGPWAVTMQLYEGLVGYEDGDKITPLLAESWTNPDTKTWVFKLKNNVKFHNGKILTATDVKTSIDNALNDPNSVPLLINTIDKVTVKNDQEVEITTKEPDAILLNKLLYLYVQGEEKLNGLPVGTGAYHVADGFDGSTGEKEMKLTVFNDYHAGKPAVQKVTYLAYDDDDQMIAAVKEGKIDITDLFLTPGQKLDELPGYSKAQILDGFIFYLGINTQDKKSPLNKLAVRQALRLSIGPEALITNIESPGQPASQITIEPNFGYNPELKPVTRDIAKAKELLKSAGYAKGVTLKLSFSESERTRKEFEEMKKQAAEAGITLVADGMGDFDTFNTNVSDGKTQLYKIGSGSAFIDSYDLFAFNFQNANYDNKEFNEILTKSNAEFNATKRKELLQEASRIIVEDGAAIPLIESKGTYYFKDSLIYKQAIGFAIPGDYIRNISAK